MFALRFQSLGLMWLIFGAHVMGQSSSDSFIGSYHGIWAKENPARFVQFVFESKENDRHAGYIDFGNNQVFPFTLISVNEDTWELKWDDSPDGPGGIDRFQIIQTPNGSCLAGNFHLASQDGIAQNLLVMIWLDQSLTQNPHKFPPLETPEIIDVVEADFSVYTAENGLAGNAVRSITQTADGYLWFGTTDGLSRFDGQDWRSFNPKSNPALPDDNITSLIPSTNGNLIVATKYSGIFFYNGLQFTPASCNEKIAQRWTRNLSQAPDGSLWFLLDESRTLCRLITDDRLTEWSLNDLFPLKLGDTRIPNTVNDIIALPENNVILGTTFGIRSFNAENQSVSCASFGWMNCSPVLSSQGGFWINYQNALVFTNPEIVPNKGINIPVYGDFIESRKSGIWLLNNSQRLVYQLKNDVAYRYQDIREKLNSTFNYILEDHEGNIWVTSASTGVGRLKPKLIQYFTTEPYGQPQVVQADDKGNVHIANLGSFVSWDGNKFEKIIMDEELKRKSPSLDPRILNRILSHECLALSFTKTNETWYGLALHGRDNKDRINMISDPIPLIARKQDETIEFFYHDDSFYGVRDGHSIAISRNDEVWYATDRGVYLWKEGEINHWDKDLHASCIFIDSSDRVLLGGYDEGLYIVDGAEVQQLDSTTDGLSSNTVLSIYQDQQGTLWLGSDEGITRISEKEIQTFKTGASFLQLPILSILEDEYGIMWFGTPNGIFAVEENSFDEILFGNRTDLRAIRFGRKDGIENESVYADFSPSAARAINGDLYFCVHQGMIRFDPVEAMRYVSGPSLKITKCLRPDRIYFDHDQPAFHLQGNQLTLPPEAQQVIAFDYSALSFAYPEDIRYEYRLQGISEQWTNADDQRRAWFTNLAPGDYSFEVRAFSHNDAISPKPATLALHIQPFYYQTWIFRLGLIGMVALLIAGLHRWRLRYRVRIKALENQIELDAERSRIARDMHDEIGSSLAQIRLLGELGRKFEGRTGESESLARQISNLAHAAAKSMREIIWSLNPDKSAVDDLEDYIRSMADQLFEGSTIQTQISVQRSTDSLILSPTFRRQLVLILKGILTNTLLHSRANELHIEVDISIEGLAFRIQDNGIGFDRSALPADAHGLSAIDQRVEEMHGSIMLESDAGKGTVYSIYLPYEQNKIVRD